MSRANTTDRDDMERKRAVEAAHADLQRRADAQGVKPFAADEWLADTEVGHSPEEIKQEVDDFLAMLREWRDTPPARSLG